MSDLVDLKVYEKTLDGIVELAMLTGQTEADVVEQLVATQIAREESADVG